VDALYAPRRTVLDPILVDAARDAGVETRFGITVTGLRRDVDGRVTGVVGRDDTGAPFSARARITVGADGMGSKIARLVGAPVEATGTSAAAFIYGYWDGLPLDRYQLFYRPGVTAGTFPTNDDQVCVFAATSRRRFRSEARAGVPRLYTRLLGQGAPVVLDQAILAPERLKVFVGRPGFLRRAYGPGWALVGDAGYFKDPITSHGITDALRDAELLADAIITAASGEASEEVALASYQSTRDRLSKPLFATTEAIASFCWDLDRIPMLLLELSDAMGDEVKLLGDRDRLHSTVSAVGG
jgi:flavin-dependent dehydrogenase